MKLLNKKLTVLCALAIAIALPTTLQAHGNHRDRDHDHRREVRDDMNRGHRGLQTISLHKEDLRSLNQRGIIGLKRAIKNKLGYSAIDQDTKLVSVDVKGRATGSMSMISLNVAGNVVDRARLRNRQCNPNRGQRCGGGKATTITLYNDSRRSQGAWKLTSDVDTKVRKVTITLKKSRTHRDKESKVSLGTSKITKGIGRSKDFYANNQKLTSITLKAKSNSLDIIDVVVKYRDGSYKVLRSLEGYLREGGSTTVRLNSYKRVSSISVDAVSDDYFGSTGRLEVVVGVTNSDSRPRSRQH